MVGLAMPNLGLSVKLKTGHERLPNESVASSGTHPRIYAVVKRVPRGKVATYAQELEERFLLEREGVTFDAAGRIPLACVSW